MRNHTGRNVVVSLAIAGLFVPLAAPASRAAGDSLARPVGSAPRLSVPNGMVAKLPLDLLGAKGSVSVFIELNNKTAADAFEENAGKGKKAAKQAAVTAGQASDANAAAVVRELRSKDRKARELFHTHNAVSGVAVIGDAAQVAQLATRADVVSISRLVPKKLTNAHAAELTKVLDTWQSTGLTGEGVRIGIIDSGVDYTHTDFRGVGTPAAFEAIDPTDATGVFPTAKVAGGTDLAGENYDASSEDPDEFIPVPDDNPLDCDGHGTHVAGTAGGFGLNSDGSTFTGDYDALTSSALEDMRVGPGMAPEATLYAVKVFGCPGGEAQSTALVAPAIDWALDPNQDGDLDDHLDVVNISIGGDYGAPDDPEAAFVRNAVKHNMVVVIAAGNAGDLYDAGGSPGDTPEALTVASSQDAFTLFDAAEVTAPADIAGLKPGQYSIAFDYDDVSVTGDVVNLTQTSNLDGCAPFNAADAARVAGKFVWLEWDDNDATRRCGSAGRSGNAVAAGAIGAIFTSGLDHFNAGITGSAVIPVFQLTGTATDELRPAMDAGALVMRLGGDLRLSIGVSDPAVEDVPSGFTSRSTRTPGVKPDVSAPGHTIVSAGIGSGNEGANNSGTSMASPHVAGIAALVREAHPNWKATEIKAAIMGTAGHDLYSQPGPTGPIDAPNRVGVGRVDALGATTNLVLPAVQDDPATVSVGFGVIEVSAAHKTLNKTIKLENKGNTAAKYQVAYQAITTMPGVSYSVDKSNVTVPAHGSATVKVTLDITRDALGRSIDPTTPRIDTSFGAPFGRQYVADASGRVVFTPTAGTTVPLRVAVYSAPKPAADITVPNQLKIKQANGSAFLELGGRGFFQGSGDETWISLYSALELGAESPKLKDCKNNRTTNCAINGTARGGDIRYVGAASTAPAENAAGSPENSLLTFGFAMWDNWYNLGSNTIPFVDIETTGDDDFDYEVFVFRPAASDLLLVETVDLHTFDVVDLEFINTLPGDLDTNVFDGNVVILPVYLETIGIDPTDSSHRIAYQAGVAGFYPAPDDFLVDFIPDMVSFDPLAPGLWAEGGDVGPVFIADPGTGLLIHKNAASLQLDHSDSLLVLNFQNTTPNRAQVVKIKK